MFITWPSHEINQVDFQRLVKKLKKTLLKVLTKAKSVVSLTYQTNEFGNGGPPVRVFSSSLMIFPTASPNNKGLAGQFASKKVIFGEFSRFALVAVHTRFESVQWVVFDAEKVDELGLTAVVAQADNPSDAVKRFL